MPSSTFTPKEVAQALGVSESSVKRWVDGGRLHAGKTAGGHRKVPLASVVDFVRRTGQAVADPSVIGLVATANKASLGEAQPDLLQNLLAGNESAVRELVLGFYQRGESVAQIGDLLIGPAFGEVGDGWQSGDIQVHQERRACEITMAVLHELRRWLFAAPSNGPLALIATPENDFAEVPPRLVELVLLSAGWSVVMAGSGLPLSQIENATLIRKPQMVCLSATHLEDPNAFLEACNHQLIRPLHQRTGRRDGVRVVVGGSGLPCDGAERLEADLVANRLADLASYLNTMD